MIINDEFFVEDAKDRRSPEIAAAWQSGQVVRNLHTLDDPVDMGTDQIKRKTRALLGYATVGTDTNGGGADGYTGTWPVTRRWINRVVPHEYTGFNELAYEPIKGLGNLYASEVMRAYPHGRTLGIEPNGQARYTNFVFQVRYDRVPWHVRKDDDVTPGDVFSPLYVAAPDPTIGKVSRPDEGYWMLFPGGHLLTRYVSRHVTDCPRMWEIPNGMLKYSEFALIGVASAGLPVGFPVVQFRQRVTYIWHGVPYQAIPRNAIAKNGGRVNRAPIDGYPIGTLLFESSREVNRQDYLGQWVADIEYNFMFMPNYDKLGEAYNGGFMGWNSVPRVMPGGIFRYAPVTTDGGAPTPGDFSRYPVGNTPYMLGHFDDLFRPDQV